MLKWKLWRGIQRLISLLYVVAVLPLENAATAKEGKIQIKWTQTQQFKSKI